MTCVMSYKCIFFTEHTLSWNQYFQKGFTKGLSLEYSLNPIAYGPSFCGFYYNLVMNIFWKNHVISMFQWKIMPVLWKPVGDIL